MKTKKYYKIIALSIALIMLSPTLAFAADNPSEITMQEADEQGFEMGKLDGDIAGRADRIAGKKAAYNLAMLSGENITKRFNLQYESDLYEQGFISAYTKGFEIGYNSGYRSVNIAEYTLPINQGKVHGESAGAIQGKMSAMVDFVQGRTDNWLRTYNEYLSEGSLSARYFLYREQAMYGRYFELGYREAFKASYIEAYQMKNVETEIRNKNAKVVSMLEDTLYFDEEFVNFSHGSEEVVTRTPLSLYFPEAAVYEPTYFAVFKTQDSFNENNYKYIPVSSKYTISVLNESGSVELREPMTLTFQYFGSERAGIYQWSNNRWEYKYTTLTDNSVSIVIPAGHYEGGEYAIFIDDEFKAIDDITFNWAKNEIYTLLRRGIVKGGENYKPSNYITRGEFANMVYQSVSAFDPIYNTIPTITDLDQLGDYKDAAKYMAAQKYLTLDKDGNFNPEGYVSYAQVEMIISKILSRTVKWSEVADKMLMTKYTRSTGTSDIHAPITKAETAYMLINFFK